MKQEARTVQQLLPLPPSGAALPAEALDVLEQAAERARHARSPNTLRAYRSDLADFEAFCESKGLPPGINGPVAAAYLDQLARLGAAMATIKRRLAALNAQLRSQNLPALSLKQEPLASVMRGIQRDIGSTPKPKRPLELEAIRATLAATGDGFAATRDRALLLLGFAGAFRRSEITGLDWGPEQSLRATDDNPKGAAGHIQETPEGLLIVLYRSKTNQAGELEHVAICRGAYAATCPVRAVLTWRQAVAEREGEARGPVFRAVDRHGRLSGDRMNPSSVACIVKRATQRAAEAEGASEDEVRAIVESVAGHSLRSGLVTTAFAAGLTAEDVMRQTRHRDVNTLIRYRRHATAFVANVSGRIGL